MYEIPVAQAMPVLRGFENGQVEGVPRSGQVPRTAILTSLCPRRKLESEEVSRIDRGTLFCPEARPGRLSRECPAIMDLDDFQIGVKDPDGLRASIKILMDFCEHVLRQVALRHDLDSEVRHSLDG